MAEHSVEDVKKKLLKTLNDKLIRSDVDLWYDLEKDLVPWNMLTPALDELTDEGKIVEIWYQKGGHSKRILMAQGVDMMIEPI